LKREHLVNPIPSCPDGFPKSSQKLMVKAQANTQAPNLEGQRRVKTSAAMIGLALSMGATGMLLPQGDSQAFAAESAQNEHTVTLPPMTLEPGNPVSRLNGSISSPSSELSMPAPAPPAIKHEIEQGDTLWKLAENYQVETDAIATSNNISRNTPLPVGKSLKIPVTPQAAEPRRDHSAAVVIQVPELEPLPQASPLEIPTLAVTASKEIQGTIAEKAPIVIPVSTPEPISSVRASETPTLRVAASPATLEDTIEDHAAPLAQPKPQVATSPSATEQPEANTDEAAVVIPDFSSEEKADTQSEVVIPAYELVEPDLAIEANNQTIQAAAPNSFEFDSQPTYQVKPGDTLDAIARRYGISRTELVEVNRLSNPNLIKVDQQLRIPTTEALQETAQGTNFPVSQPRTVADNAPRISVDAQIETPTERSLEQLQADIEKLQQNYGGEANSAVASEPEAIEITVIPAFAEDSSNNPEWEAARNEITIQVENFKPAPRSTETVRPTPTASQQSQQDLVAAAPISVEAYNPMLQTPVGEMVAPGVPSLSPPEEYLPDSPQRFDGYIWPAKGVLTSGYGWRWGRMHKGVDIAAPIGTPIVAAAPGEVISSGWNSGGYGNLVKVKHYDGSVTLYAHNNRNLVRQGQKVEQGQQIAEMGSTGYSTGPHLHFEVHPAGGAAQNPMAFLPKR
jgi:murein DD-endopeptidase MepM/ murein hydrolase activator NlpD